MNVLLTGASKGLGLQIATNLLQTQNTVYAISRSKTDDIINLQKQYPNNLFFKSFDLDNTQNIKKKLFTDFINFDIKLDAYINNAAIAYDDIITNLQIKPLQQMYNINVFSPMIIVKNVIRNMLYNKNFGKILHISSISVHTGYKGLAMYASTKGAIEAFSKNTAREWGAKKITSNCLVAGFMNTNMSSSLTLQQKQKIYKRTSLKTAVDIKSVASTALFLISPKANSITGQNIFVDAGTI